MKASELMIGDYLQWNGMPFRVVKVEDYWVNSNRRKFDLSKRVEVEGKTYAPVSVENKTSCVGCDILKARQPRSPASQPLCYEHVAFNHKIYEMCQGHQIIWKEVRQ